MRHILYAALTFAISMAKYTYNDESGDELLYVVDFVRHGSRAPKYQDRINSTKVYFNDGLGQITPMGMRQLYLRGLENKRRYIENTPYFLNSTYSPEEIEIFSSDEGRVLRSALSYFMGLFPPNSTLNNLSEEEIATA
jgi:hypothetical protein